MVRYRRSYVPGGTYFFTVTLRDRKSSMLTDYIDLLRGAFRDVRKARPFEIDAIVALPEHLHAVITLPVGDADYSVRWKEIKGGFSKSLARAGIRVEKDQRGEYRPLETGGFWGAHHFADETGTFKAHVGLQSITNPVQARIGEGRVCRLGPYSSFSSVTCGLGLGPPQNWGKPISAGFSRGKGTMGERGRTP